MWVFIFLKKNDQSRGADYHKNNLTMGNQHTHQHDTIALSEEDGFRAILSNDIAYSLRNSDLGATSAERFQNAIDRACDKYPHYSDRLHQLENIQSDQNAIALKTGDTGYIVIRGTDPDHAPLADGVNDGQIAIGDAPHRLETVNQMYGDVKTQHPEITNWEATGHSLGGTIAEGMGMQNSDLVVTAFNPGRSPLDIMDNLTPHTYDNITEHRMEGDLWNNGSGIAGNVHTYSAPNDQSPHLMDNYTHPLETLAPTDELIGLPMDPDHPPEICPIGLPMDPGQLPDGLPMEPGHHPDPNSGLPMDPGHHPDIDPIGLPMDPGHHPDICPIGLPMDPGHGPDIDPIGLPMDPGHGPDLFPLGQPMDPGHFPDICPIAPSMAPPMEPPDLFPLGQPMDPGFHPPEMCPMITDPFGDWSF